MPKNGLFPGYFGSENLCIRVVKGPLMLIKGLQGCQKGINGNI